jgi:integrase
MDAKRLARLRHTYRSLLGDSSISMDVQKELMRHASITTTMDVYGSAVADSKRQAHSGVVKQLLN